MSEDVLKGLLPELYYIHWKLFIKAYRILSKASLTSEEILVAEACLQAFYKGVEEYYSPQYLTIKVHQLIHAPDAARNYGPLRNISSYLFEDLNGQLIDLNHATNNPIEHLHIRFSRLNYLRAILHSMRDRNDQEFHAAHPFVNWLEKFGWRYLDKEDLKQGGKYMNGLSTRYTYKCPKKSSIFQLDRKILDILFQAGYKLQLSIFEHFKIKYYKFHTDRASIYKNDSR